MFLRSSGQVQGRSMEEETGGRMGFVISKLGKG